MTAILSPAPEGGPYLLPEGGSSLRPRARASYYQEVVAFSLGPASLPPSKKADPASALGPSSLSPTREGGPSPYSAHPVAEAKMA